MAVVQSPSRQLGSYALDSLPRLSDVAPRTRISARRVVGLALPGLILVDAGLVTGSFLLALRLFASPGAVSEPSLLRPQMLALFAVLFTGFLVLGGMFGLYSRACLLRPRRAMAAAARAVFWSGVVAVVFGFLLALDPPGDFRWVLVKHAFLLGLGALALRPLVCRGLLRLSEVGPVHPRRVLILGDGAEARRLAAALAQEASEELFITGFASLADSDARGPRPWARFSLASWSEARELADALAVDEVLIATDRISRGEAVSLAFALAPLSIRTSVMPRLCRMQVEGTPIDRARSVPLTRLGPNRRRGWENALKRGTDLLLASLAVLLLLPVLLLIALAVKSTSRGPVLYAQTRVGRNGRPFRMYKFRSMKAANDDSHYRDYIATLVKEGNAAGRDAAGRPVYKLMDDPRVTVIGKIIRATSMDELPQLINVLRGEMSLVGPRPCLPFEYELYEEWQRGRLDTIPGMTGLWQVSGRNLLSFEEMVLLDLFYVANWSFPLDLKILWSTIPEVISPGGAK
ncbi:MAG: exopolysaccharide biosynthesis polyprenyl glycosylphosphotransferase [Candidatus Eisenbacteria bacterium]|nr:exopolysaccharide biosynthesis polyprenyl glycosylphosphotransferase [Candidatus Eisenbacteria bacterium]